MHGSNLCLSEPMGIIFEMEWEGSVFDNFVGKKHLWRGYAQLPRGCEHPVRSWAKTIFTNVKLSRKAPVINNEVGWELITFYCVSETKLI